MLTPMIRGLLGVTCLISAFLCAPIPLAHADIPQTIHYQGKLTEPDGTPLVGEHAVVFRLYADAVGGGALWEERHALRLVNADNGVFAVVLGSKTPFGSTMTFNNTLWMTVEVDEGGEFTPRQLLSAASYALNADRLDGMDSTQLLAAMGAGDITALTAGPGLTGGGTAGDVTLAADIGTTAGKLVQLDARGALPAVSGEHLTGLSLAQLSEGAIPDNRLSPNVSLLGAAIESAEVADATLTAADTSDTLLIAGSGVAVAKDSASWTISATGSDGDVTAVQAGAGLIGGGTAGDFTLDVGAGTGLLVSDDALSVDAGTAAGQIVQLDGNGALPAVSGANLTGLNATNLSVGMIPDARLSSNISRLGASIDSTELEAGAVASSALAADSVGASALSASAIQAGDIEAGDLPAHAASHQPGGSDALPTASAVSVGSGNAAGASASLARADHVHQGLHSLRAEGQSQVVGDATLAPGANVALSQAGQTITVSSIPANKVTSAASSAAAISASSDTTLATATITKAQAESVLLILATVQLSHTGNPNNKTVDVKLFQGATQLDANYTVVLGTAAQAVSSVPVTIHGWVASPAGTHTLTLRARAGGNGAQATMRRLTVLEIF